MIRVLFVCWGNICRSPMAEFILKDMTEKAGIADRFEIASAGISSEEIWNGVGNPVYPPAREILRRHGISCDGKRARQITKVDYARYDLLICMEPFHIKHTKRVMGGDPEGKIRLLLDYTDRKGEGVADPWYTHDFQTAWDDIEEGCRGMLGKDVDNCRENKTQP